MEKKGTTKNNITKQQTTRATTQYTKRNKQIKQHERSEKRETHTKQRNKNT